MSADWKQNVKSFWLSDTNWRRLPEYLPQIPPNRYQGKIRPLRDSPSDAEAIHSEAPHPVHVLQVDDSESQRVLLQTILSDSPCMLDTAENGEVGFNKFVAGNYDLVFMDMQMPVMDGCTATRKIRAWEKENHQAPTPIIAMTANALA